VAYGIIGIIGGVFGRYFAKILNLKEIKRKIIEDIKKT